MGLDEGRIHLFAVFTGVCFSAACSQQESVELRASAVTSTLTVAVPAGVKIGDVAIGAARMLSIGDRTVVTGPIANTGSAGSALGISARSGTVTSVAPIDLRTNAHVGGDAGSGGTVTRAPSSTVASRSARHYRRS